MKDNGSNASMRFLWIFLMCKTLSIMLLTVSTCNDKKVLRVSKGVWRTFMVHIQSGCM